MDLLQYAAIALLLLMIQFRGNEIDTKVSAIYNHLGLDKKPEETK